jgi:periplasmic protein TonB
VGPPATPTPPAPPPPDAAPLGVAPLYPCLGIVAGVFPVPPVPLGNAPPPPDPPGLPNAFPGGEFPPEPPPVAVNPNAVDGLPFL